MQVNICSTLALLMLLGSPSMPASAGDAAAQATSRLQGTTVLDGKVSLLLPKDFKPLSAELLATKYPNSNRPNLVYSNDGTTVNVALDHTVHSLRPDQLGEALEQVMAGMKGAYPSATWFVSGVRKINGKPFFLVEVRTPAIVTEVRNIIAGTSVDNRLLMISFNTTRALEPDWMPVGRQIIESIRVK